MRRGSPDGAARQRLNRRAFLKLSAAFGLAAYLRPPVQPVIASTHPLPFPHHYFPNAELLLTQPLGLYDLLVVPAYLAAELIRRGALRQLNGDLPQSTGRAHDPEGAFTLPYAFAIGGLAYRGLPPKSWDDLWNSDALWPDSSRLVLGAALLRRGYPLNDTHPGHLAQIEEDLIRRRPRIVPDPLAGLRSGISTLALAPILVSAGEADFSILRPPEGAALIEYDWAIPAGSSNTQLALNFINHTHHASLVTPHASLIPLTPLPTRALAQRAAIWSRVKRSGQSQGF
jgi:spermidine/putrescine-binding protein